MLGGSLLVAVLSGASHATAAPTKPSAAYQLALGVPYSATIDRRKASTEWLRVPTTMRPGDSVTFASSSSASEIRYCLVPPIDDYGQIDAENRCGGPGYTGKYPHVDVDAGMYRRTLTWTEPTAQGFILVQPGCGFCGSNIWTYSLTVERMVTRVNIGAPLLEKSSRRISLAAGATLGDNTPAPDGIAGRLSWRLEGGPAQQIAQTATSSGGRLQFDAELPPEAAGSTVELTACVDQIGGGEPVCTTQAVEIDGDADKDGVSPPADCDDGNSSIRPGLPEIADNAIDENCDGVVARHVRAATKVTLRRRGRTYSGRVRGAVAVCTGGRQIVVRRAGSSKDVRRLVTRPSGRFDFRRPKARRRYYVLVKQRTIGLTICGSVRSRRLASSG